MRDASIDILKFVGLSCIILVHCKCPFVISQLRCFDVPLMLFVSGLAYSGKSLPDYSDYIIKRAKRLLIPTWSFVTVFFMIVLGVKFLFHRTPFPLSYIIESYVMTGGIGYVWIVRVFLLVAIITPLIMRIEKCMANDNKLILSMLVGGGIVDVLVLYTHSYIESSFMQRMMNEWVITTMAYSLFFCLGLRMRRIESVRNWRITSIFTMILMVALVFYYFQHGFPIRLSPTYKYPPHSYYVLYGFFACSLLWSARDCYAKILNCKPILFIGQNTIWIYLYHILLLYIPLPFNWLVKYLIVYGCSLLIFAIQYTLYLKLKNKYSTAKYLIG